MEMMTPYSIRAEELREIYNSINMKYLTQDERLDVLLTLKHTVKVRRPELSMHGFSSGKPSVLWLILAVFY